MDMASRARLVDALRNEGPYRRNRRVRPDWDEVEKIGMFGDAIATMPVSMVRALYETSKIPGQVYRGEMEPTVENATNFALDWSLGGAATAPLRAPGLGVTGGRMPVEKAETLMRRVTDRGRSGRPVGERPLPIGSVEADIMAMALENRSLYHHGPEGLPGGKPSQGAHYFGDRAFIESEGSQFGPQRYSYRMPPDMRVLDIAKDTPEARKVVGDLVKRRYGEDLPDDWASGIDELYGDFADRSGPWEDVLAEHGYDGVKFGGETLLSSGGVRKLLPQSGALPPQGIRAYHGSPHDFERFSMEHIGKGEGAQAYGHGLYFAEHPDVAKSYRMDADARFNRVTTGSMTPKQELAHDMADNGATDWDIIQTLGRKYDDLSFDQAQELATEALSKRGRMYEVSINASPDEFLDWDKPLSEQPKKILDALHNAGILGRETPEQAVRKRVTAYTREGMDDEPAIERVYREINDEMSQALDAGNDALYDELSDMDYAIRQWWDSGTMAEGASGVDPSAGSLLQELERSLAEKSNIVGVRNPQSAAEALRAAGIKGIRYLDQGSRASGTGTSNYVVFDDKIIDILKKYGIAGLTAGGIGAAMTAEEYRNYLKGGGA